jgi:hypothetical protein
MLNIKVIEIHMIEDKLKKFLTDYWTHDRKLMIGIVITVNECIQLADVWM